MNSYAFPLGQDHPDRDLARLTADLRALPTGADGSPVPTRRARWALRRARFTAALSHRVRVQAELHDRLAAPVHPAGCGQAR